MCVLHNGVDAFFFQKRVFYTLVSHRESPDTVITADMRLTSVATGMGERVTRLGRVHPEKSSLYNYYIMTLVASRSRSIDSSTTAITADMLLASVAWVKW